MRDKNKSELNIERNLCQVNNNISKACKRANRNTDDIILCAVSKTKPLSDIETALSCGQHIFGENYVQELTSKYDVLGDKAEWHMIGHLQRNKVKYIIGKVSLIHSVDSIQLAETIEKESAKRDLVTDILLEVNIAGEDSKFGFTPESTPDAVVVISHYPHVRIRGLMTSAPYTEDPESNRLYFRDLRKLFDGIGRLNIPNVSMDILSMGMTGDYEVAVEEGSTMVRVGTGIFGARDYHI